MNTSCREDKKGVIYVSGKSNVQLLASSINIAIKEYGIDKIECRAIGASSVNQLVKALAVLRGMISPKGIDLAFVPGFDVTVEDGSEKTVVVMYLKKI